MTQNSQPERLGIRSPLPIAIGRRRGLVAGPRVTLRGIWGNLAVKKLDLSVSVFKRKVGQAGVRRWSRILRREGIETFELCQGGPG
jgi:hypothetical protein